MAYLDDLGIGEDTTLEELLRLLGPQGTGVKKRTNTPQATNFGSAEEYFGDLVNTGGYTEADKTRFLSSAGAPGETLYQHLRDEKARRQNRLGFNYGSGADTRLDREAAQLLNTSAMDARRGLNDQIRQGRLQGGTGLLEKYRIDQWKPKDNNLFNIIGGAAGAGLGLLDYFKGRGGDNPLVGGSGSGGDGTGIGGDILGGLAGGVGSNFLGDLLGGLLKGDNLGGNLTPKVTTSEEFGGLQNLIGGTGSDTLSGGSGNNILKNLLTGGSAAGGLLK